MMAKILPDLEELQGRITPEQCEELLARIEDEYDNWGEVEVETENDKNTFVQLLYEFLFP